MSKRLFLLCLNMFKYCLMFPLVSLTFSKEDFWQSLLHPKEGEVHYLSRQNDSLRDFGREKGAFE